MTPEMYSGHISTVVGEVFIRPVAVDEDAQRLHTWITHPRSKFWGALEATAPEIRDEYLRIAASPAEDAWILELDDRPIALAETYDPARVGLADCQEYDHQAGDIGMHILVSPIEGEPVHGLTDALMSALVRWLFSHSGHTRVVVEPDADNHAMHAKNARVGFRQPGTPVCLPFGAGIKDALLQLCTEDDFLSSPAAPLSALQVKAAPQTAGTRESAAQTHRVLLAKAIQEFTHERLIEPVDVETGQPVEANGGRQPSPGWKSYRVKFGDLTITFTGRLHALLHLAVDPESLQVEGDENWQPNVISTIANAAGELGIPDNFLHTYLEEISATFAARSRTRALPRPSVAELTDDSRQPVELFQAIETAMTGGHPGFVANSGRGGMGETQLRAWAPELNTSTKLVWCAAKKEHTQLAGGEHSSADDVMKAVAPWFHQAAEKAGLIPEDYVPFPVHPWQWEQVMTTAFAADLAAGRLVPLGFGEDLYRPQQSLRTFFDFSRPAVPYVKTAVAVRNMGFTRGLSDTYMASTPAANDWLIDKLGDDPEFVDNGVGFLPEIATVAYTGDIYHSVARKHALSGSPHLKMSAALWRQSPFDDRAQPPIAEGQTVSTMAAVLHRDESGKSMLSAWIEQSGRTPEQWVDALLRVYLRPLVHMLLTQQIVFMPHTENVILRLEQGFPVGAYHKDLGEEMAVVSRTAELPEELERLRADCGPDGPECWQQQALSIHTDAIDGVLRHVAAILDTDGVLTQEAFWERARLCLSDYAEKHPDQAKTGLWEALLAPTFKHSTLNRLQLRNPHTMVDISDQNSSLIYAGTLPNPLAPQN